jgi:hypothetical protein
MSEGNIPMTVFQHFTDLQNRIPITTEPKICHSSQVLKLEKEKVDSFLN